MAQTKIARGNTDAQAPPIVLSLDGLSKLLKSLAEGTDPEACHVGHDKDCHQKVPQSGAPRSHQEPLETPGALRNHPPWLRLAPPGAPRFPLQGFFPSLSPPNSTLVSPGQICL